MQSTKYLYEFTLTQFYYACQKIIIETCTSLFVNYKIKQDTKRTINPQSLIAKN